MLRKVLIYLRLYWLRIIIVLISLVLLTWMISFMIVGNQNYEQLESFSRRNISAQMGQSLIMFIFVTLIQAPLTFGMYYWLMSGGAAGKMGQIDLKKTKVNIKMTDVIGMDVPKREALELVKLLKDRTMIKKIGGKIVKGTMMIGPPGCGKTYLAKAIATEAGLPFLSAVGSEFVGMFVGQGAARMKSLFKQARTLADLDGGCIIFIDEIDSFARPRMQDQGFGGGVSSHNATINQFLTELDGLRKAENNIIVIAATNADEGELDEAIMRSGRFERKIHVSLPNLKERQDIFDFYLKKVKAAAEVNSSMLARKTLWFSPADIDYMVREGSLISLREMREEINMKDLSEAYDRIAFGMKSNIKMSDKERLWTAYHEAGHAVISYLIHPTNDVIKASVIPRKGSLGMIFDRPQEETYSKNKEAILAEIKVNLAAYVAERIKFGSTTTGVGGGPGADFYTAMNWATKMVYSFGMGKSGLVGDFSYYSGTGNTGRAHFVSEKTKETLDGDVQEILQTCIKDVETILVEKRELLEFFAQELYRKEELEYDEIESIFQQFGVKPLTRAQIV